MSVLASRRVRWAALGAYTAIILALLFMPGDDVSRFAAYERSGHVAMFGGFTLLFYWAYEGDHEDRLARALGAGLGLGLATEIGQAFIPTRSFSLADLVMDAIGCVVVAAGLRFWSTVGDEGR